MSMNPNCHVCEEEDAEHVLCGSCLNAAKSTERLPLTHSAVRVDGVVWSLPKPYRHHDVLRVIYELSPVKYNDSEERDQGFLDASGRYLTRKQALVNAVLHKQIKNGGKLIGGPLTSEDLW